MPLAGSQTAPCVSFASIATRNAAISPRREKLLVIALVESISHNFLVSHAFDVNRGPRELKPAHQLRCTSGYTISGTALKRLIPSLAQVIHCVDQLADAAVLALVWDED